MASSADNLKALRAQLEAIHENLPRLRLNADTRPPIIDINFEFEQTAVDDEDDSNVTTSVSTSGKSSPSGSSATGDRKASGCAKGQIAARHPYNQTLSGIPGLRIIRGNVRHDIEQIDKVSTPSSLSVLSRSRQHMSPIHLVVPRTLCSAPYKSHSILLLDERSLPHRGME